MATTVINVPATVTFTNIGTKSVAIMPYGQNFTVAIPAGDALQFKVDNAIQVLYYLGQATADLTVTQAAITA